MPGPELLTNCQLLKRTRTAQSNGYTHSTPASALNTVNALPHRRQQRLPPPHAMAQWHGGRPLSKQTQKSTIKEPSHTHTHTHQFFAGLSKWATRKGVRLPHAKFGKSTSQGNGSCLLPVTPWYLGNDVTRVPMISVSPMIWVAFLIEMCVCVSACMHTCAHTLSVK